MKKEIITLILALIILGGIGGIYYFSNKGTSTGVATTTPSTATSATPPLREVTMSDGVGFAYPTKDYSLATTSDQVLVLSYIRPCDDGFDYCLYNTSPDFSGTNFESAGLRIKARPDLTTKQACLATPPAGRPGLSANTSLHDGYATSAFSVDGAAAGHYSSGTLYRLYASSHCTEFETRIGESQFANFPAGSIQKFTDSDRARVEAELLSILASVKVSGAPIVFPASGKVSNQSSGGGAGASCGGFIKNAPTCATGYHCKLGAIADKGGVCVAD
ncbi:MAG: hypothetical protein ACYCZZ_00410 [Minisyncoccota bacterium]